ncbi:ATP-dependent DNA helicase Q-like 4A [Vitis vinifera]|uniref:ATP-dependent DNA helicase Q-like 4A n=1 Tax=Vitis vinifera TaxID=29760 RepID=A0A438GVT0_VITVI|nr:ATP-dependent DNA helicase Q-like 4A [Vitis vinifera]
MICQIQHIQRLQSLQVEKAWGALSSLKLSSRNYSKPGKMAPLLKDASVEFPRDVRKCSACAENAGREGGQNETKPSMLYNSHIQVVGQSSGTCNVHTGQVKELVGAFPNGTDDDDILEDIDVDQIVMEHYQSTCIPQPSISKLPPVTPTLSTVNIAKHEETFLPLELCSNCSHGFKLGLCPEAANHLQELKDMLIVISNELLDNVDLTSVQVEKLRQDRLYLNKQIQQLEIHLHSVSVDEERKNSNFSASTTTPWAQFQTPPATAVGIDPMRFDAQVHLRNEPGNYEKWNTSSVSFSSIDRFGVTPYPLEREPYIPKLIEVNYIEGSSDKKWSSGNFPWTKKLEANNKKVFGNHSFRPNQREVINATMSGYDVFVLMPTGGGKSLTYQRFLKLLTGISFHFASQFATPLPALISPGITLVISPLVSLIQDQIMHLLQANIPAAYLSASMEWNEQQEILRELSSCKYKLLYATPEKVANRCLGMPTEGFEEVILYLLRMKGRIDRKGWEDIYSGEQSILGVQLVEFSCFGITDWWSWLIWKKRFSQFRVGSKIVWMLYSVGVHWSVWPVCSRDREDLWEELGSIKGLWSDPWCVGGDFNLVRFLEEHSRGEGLTASMRRFSEVVEDLELRDFPLMGGPFTWRGGLNNQAQSRLDRFLVTDKWDSLFNGAVQGILPKPVSDHFPVLLEEGVESEGCWHSEENNLKNSVVGAFQKLYSEEKGWLPCIDELSFMGLVSSEAEGLEIPFTEEDVFAALLDLGKDKALGPDGFTMAFWFFCWDVMKVEIMGFFREFHERGRFVKSLNATFLVLVPKKEGAEDLKEFRPISLVGSLYKLKSNQGGVLCKLDIKKTYDHVSWKFLLAVLKKMGFGESSRGLRQGDPLSPYLFVIAMEVFSCSLRMTISGDFLSRWRACSRLRVNLEKSKLILMGRVHDIEDLALELSCKVGGLPSCYLVLPLGAPFKSKVVWDGVEERFRKRLAMWKRQYISKGGRLTLIRSTLSSMLLHVSLLYAQKSKVEVGEDSEGFSMGWRSSCVEATSCSMELGLFRKKKRCLGVRNLALLNKALLRGRMVYLGRKQEDKWCGDEPLCESFPSLFAISLAKDTWVSDVWNLDGVGDGWTPLFSMAFNDWEIEMVERFILKIQAFRVQREDEDKVVWTTSKSGAFSVKSLNSILEPRGSSLFPCGNIWRANVPPKVAFFAWEASWGKILTLEQL